MDPFEAGKRAAGRAAAELVTSGMRVGLGTGSTVAFFLERLGERRAQGLDLVGVATSRATEARCAALGLPLATFDDVDGLDLAVDGADEIDAAKNMIKGGGGALVRERIVAAAAREMVVIVSANKVVGRLGSTFSLPVEVIPFGWRPAAATLAKAFGVEPVLRRSGTTPALTDNGNYVLDCKFEAFDDPGATGAALRAVPGVVDHGLFVAMAGRVLVGNADGSVSRLA